jgi:phosphotransferase system HPr (HPr) family protein
VTSQEITVVNRLGLHARAAARFVSLAVRYGSRVQVAVGSRVVDGKSILQLLLLGAASGTALTISADGPDEGDAVQALAALAAEGFDDQ